MHKAMSVEKFSYKTKVNTLKMTKLRDYRHAIVSLNFNHGETSFSTKICILFYS